MKRLKTIKQTEKRVTESRVHSEHKTLSQSKKWPKPEKDV